MTGLIGRLFRKKSRQAPAQKKERAFITDAFIKRVANEGSLAEACHRLARYPRNDLQPLPKMSTWALICEEVVDTEYDAIYYDRVVQELHRRNFTDEQIREMRVFAWQTAGWLNFEKMLWDWCSLDEDDILTALGWQEKEGEITAEERKQAEQYVERYR